MPAVCVTWENAPDPSQIESLARDGMKIIESHMATSHPKIMGLASVRLATIHEGGNVGAFGRIWPIVLNTSHSSLHQEFKSVGCWVLRPWYYTSGGICQLFSEGWFAPRGGGEWLRTYMPVVLSQATRTHLPDPSGVMQVPPISASLLAAFLRLSQSGGLIFGSPWNRVASPGLQLMDAGWNSWSCSKGTANACSSMNKRYFTGIMRRLLLPLKDKARNVMMQETECFMILCASIAN